MTPPPEARFESAAVWLEFAEVDLAAARKLVEADLLAPACFHAQQAAEKALKAYLVALGESRLPHTHNLTQLARAAAALGGEMIAGEGVRKLTDYAVEIRYPDAPAPDENEAGQALAWAAEIVREARQRIEQARNQTKP
ncbi:MAG TPA: HEPN domain-containing protein [Armatimonadota bacterium]|jgi:HEPN domain-containing protein